MSKYNQDAIVIAERISIINHRINELIKNKHIMNVMDATYGCSMYTYRREIERLEYLALVQELDELSND